MMARAHFNPDHTRGLARDAIKAEIAGMQDCIAEWRQAQLDAQEDDDMALAASIGREIAKANAHVGTLVTKLASA